MKNMMKRKKIKLLYILPKQQMGGAEIQLLNLVRNINKNIFDVYVGLLYQKSELKSEFDKLDNVKVVKFNKKSSLDLRVYFKIAAFIKKERIDIVQAFLTNHHAYIPAFLAGRSIPVGGIRSTQDDNNSAYDRLVRFTLVRLFSKVKKIYMISNSHAGKDIYARHKFPNNNMFVVPNGIDISRFSKGSRQKIIREFRLQNNVVLGMVARIDEKKNHEELIRIFRGLQNDFKNLRLLIIGDGPNLARLKQIVKDMNLDSKVIFTGLRKDIPDFLAAMDIFVFPSKFPEGWPNVVGEAMCAGVPVVSYPCGDVERIIKNGFDGIITEPNEDSFMSELVPLIKSSSLRKRLGSNARNTIQKKFSIPVMVKQYEQIYQKIMQR